MRVKISSKFTLYLPKQLCRDKGLNVGDFYDIQIQDNGDIILSHIESSNEISPVLNNNLSEIKPEKENINKLSNDIDIQKISDITHELELQGVDSLYLSNLDKSLTISRKYYSECGLFVRTKTKYVREHCKKCMGKMLDYYPGEYKCSYCNTNINTEDVNIKINKELNNNQDISNQDNNLNIEELDNNIANNYVEESNCNLEEINDNKDINISEGGNFNQEEKHESSKLSLKNIIRQEDLQEAKQQNKYTIYNINKNIQQLIDKMSEEYGKMNNPVINAKDITDSTLIEEVNSNQKDKVIQDDNYLLNSIKWGLTKSDTKFEAVRYNRLHQCCICESIMFSGFLVNSKYFVCKSCMVEDYKKFLQLNLARG